MRIEGISMNLPATAVPLPDPTTTVDSAGGPTDAPALPPNSPDSGGNAGEADGAAPAASGEALPKAKGVLRLLNEGHFRPVADVRLRINFFDELARQAQSATAERVKELDDSLAADLSSALAASADPDDPDTAQALADAVNSLGQALPSANPMAGSILPRAEQAVSDFLASVSGILAPAEPPPADESETPVEDPQDVPVADEADEEPLRIDLSLDGPEETGENDLLVAIQELITAYLERLTDVLTEGRAGLQITPAENVPGKAYPKFLAMYQDLVQGFDPGDENEPPAGAIDTTA